MTVTTARSLGLYAIKAVTDGLIGAAQWTAKPHPEGTPRLTANLARTGVTADESRLRDLLCDPTGAALGHCPGLIAKDGRVGPDDHLLVAGIVNAEHDPLGLPRLRAEIHAAVPSTDTQTASSSDSDGRLTAREPSRRSGDSVRASQADHLLGGRLRVIRASSGRS